jgi:predicted CxxxxCH...CXXCH cytochrome family protein
VDGVKTWQFSTTLRATAINQSAGSCDRDVLGDVLPLRRRRDAAPFSATASAALAWTTGTSTCRSCHGWDAAAAPTIGVAAGSSFQGSASTRRHVANAGVIGTNYFCGDCHQNTVGAGTNSPHLDRGARERDEGHLDREPRPHASTDTTATCSATYTSSGQRGAANVKRTVTWTDAAWTSVCTGCHGTGVSNDRCARLRERRRQHTATSNSHAKHVGSSASCPVCPTAVTVAGTAIAARATRTASSM